MSGRIWKLPGLSALVLVAASCGAKNVYWLYLPHDVKAERMRSQVIAVPLEQAWPAAERRLAALKAKCINVDRESGLMTCVLPGVSPHIPKLDAVAYVSILMLARGPAATRVSVNLVARTSSPDQDRALFHSNGEFERQLFAAIAAGTASSKEGQ